MTYFWNLHNILLDPHMCHWRMKAKGSRRPQDCISYSLQAKCLHAHCIFSFFITAFTWWKWKFSETEIRKMYLAMQCQLQVCNESNSISSKGPQISQILIRFWADTSTRYNDVEELLLMIILSYVHKIFMLHTFLVFCNSTYIFWKIAKITIQCV